MNVQALVALGRIDDALRQAADGVASLQKAGERKLAAVAMKSVMHAHIANGDGQNALTVGKQAADTFLQLNDQGAHAGMLLELARFYFAVGDYFTAKETAEKAIPYFKELSDTAGHAAAMEIFGAAEDAEEQENEKPHSEVDREALMQKVAEALQMGRGDELRQLCEECYEKGIGSRALKAYLKPLVFDVNPEQSTELMNFWIDHQPPYLEFGDGLMAEATYFQREDVYFYFRSAGSMGYGPGFRLMRNCWRTGKASENPDVRSISVLSLKDDHDLWEEKVTMGHPGIIDCSLQTGIMGVWPIPHSSEIK